MDMYWSRLLNTRRAVVSGIDQDQNRMTLRRQNQA
jgi:hypothetical protein